MARIQEEITSQLISRAFELCEANNITLTSQAAAFIQFAAAAIISDPPREVADSAFVDYEKHQQWLGNWAIEVFTQALLDGRVRRDLEAQRAVSFPTIMRVLSDHGFQSLKSMGFK